jgi:hypothetical protein
MEHIAEPEQKNLKLEDLPAHHRRNPIMLANALMHVKEYSPHLSAMADILVPRLPRKVKASQNIKTDYKDKGSYLFTLTTGIDCPWISWDSRDFWNVLALDVDHQDGLTLSEELPENIRPFLVVDPYSLRSAALFVLKTPILTTRFGQLALGELCQQALSDYFRATPLPHCTLTKNPFGLKSSLMGNLKRRTAKPQGGILWDMFKDSPLVFHTLQGSAGIELRDILNYFGDDIELTQPKRQKPEKVIFINRGEPSDLGRNCRLFDVLRSWCYDNRVKEFSEIMEEARNLNEGGLSESELKSISRSISKFMRTRYKPTKKIKVMKLSASLDTKSKQKLSAMRTHDVHRDNTDHKISQALRHWPDGHPITQKALAEASGMSLKTIKRRWKDLFPTL